MMMSFRCLWPADESGLWKNTDTASEERVQNLLKEDGTDHKKLTIFSKSSGMMTVACLLSKTPRIPN